MIVEPVTPSVVRPPARPGLAGAGVLAALTSMPERLLLAFLWCAYVTAAAYTTGFFRPEIVFPAAVVVVALTWRLADCREDDPPDGTARRWQPALGSTLAVAAAAVWFLLNLPYLSERVLVNRDPDVYTLTALWLLDHTSPSIPISELSNSSPGFGLTDGMLLPQGYHLISGVSAAAGWVFGEEAVFWGNLACGAAALLGLYVLGRRLLGPLWALVPVLALAASLPMLEFSRALYSEPLAMTFTFLGATLLWRGWQRDRIADYLLAGAAFGGVALARIDGTMPLTGVLVGLTLAAFVHPGRNESRRRWAAPLVLLGSLPGMLMGLADGLLHSGTYVMSLQGQLILLSTGLAVSGVISVVGALVRVRTARPAHAGRGLRLAASAAAALTAVGFGILLSRPWWYVGHDDLDNGVLIAIQEREGLPVDGTRTYAEDVFEWISWYYGWPVVVVGLAGLLIWLVVGARGRCTQLLWLAALFLPASVLYLTTPSITPDQIWAMRRFLPLVVPGILLTTVWLARALAARGHARGGLARISGVLVATALVVSAAVWPVTSVPPMWAEKNNAGAWAGIRQVCAEIDGRPTIVAGLGNYLATVHVLCDVPVIGIREPTPYLLAQARQELGGEAFLVTHAPGIVPWKGEPAAQEWTLTWTQDVWEQSLVGPPDEVFETTLGLALGVVQPDGTVAPLRP